MNCRANSYASCTDSRHNRDVRGPSVTVNPCSLARKYPICRDSHSLLAEPVRPVLAFANSVACGRASSLPAEIVKINPDKPESQLVTYVAEQIRSGRVLCMP